MKHGKSPTKSRRNISRSSKKSKNKPRLFNLTNSLLLLIIVFVVITTIVKLTEAIISHNSSTNLPKLEIFLADVPIEQIDISDKSIKYPGNAISLKSHDTELSLTDVEIKGRGNLTWGFAKKPYQIKLPQKTSLLDLPKAKKWLLLADYLDNTHLRNNLAFFLQRLIGSDNPINAKYVELYIDNNYRGLYLLTEKIEIDKSRIDLKDPSGIIMELDNLHNTNESCPSYSIRGDCFMIQDSVNPDQDGATIFLDKFNQLEIAIDEKDFATVESLIDIDSFAKYFLLNEFINNPDSYSSSLFFIVDGENDVVHAGSGWDFDLAFGNKLWATDDVDYEEFLSPSNVTVIEESLPEDRSSILTSSYLNRVSPIFYKLNNLPEFSSRVREIYLSTISGHLQEILNYANAQANYIKDSIQRDQERWKLDANFDDELSYLTDWITKRYLRFEEIFNTDKTNPKPF